MKAWARKQKGFTIVELLIVIVVIAILAAITVVAYNGIQTRAENTKTTNMIAAYVKALTLYAVDNGTYPSSAAYPCLGIYSNNQCGHVAGPGTAPCNLTGATTTNTTFDNQISQYLGSSKPEGSTQVVQCNGDTYVGAHMNANSTDPKNLSMQVFYKGNIECPAVGGIAGSSRTQVDGTTRCWVSMPTLP